MEALILNGRLDQNPLMIEFETKLFSYLKKDHWNIDHQILKDLQITPCQGCFDCWVKSPGICKIDDFGRDIVEKIVKSDLIVHLTPITFGGYSSAIKKALDRSIPVLLPFFRTVKGEIHHKQRYENRAPLLSIGYLKYQDDDKIKTFHTLIERNSRNMAPPFYKSLIYLFDENNEEIVEEIKLFLQEVKNYYE